MIKINLLRNKVADSGGSETEISAALDQGLGPSSQSSLLVNFTLLLCGVLSLYMYQSYNLSSLNEIYKQKNDLLTTSRQKIEKLKKESKKAKKAQEKIVAIEKRMKILKELSKSRLSELKALDYLQTILPDRVWFTKINYSKKNFTFDGFALSDDDFNLFMERLESGGVLLNIIPVRFAEASSAQGQGKSFTVTCRLGNI